MKQIPEDDLQKGDGESSSVQEHGKFSRQAAPGRRHLWFLIVFTLLVFFAAITGAYIFINGVASSDQYITDSSTPERLPQVPQTETSFLVEWGIDSMDRGNHDFEAHEHGKLVVEKAFGELKRGEAVYYKLPEFEHPNKEANISDMQIGRVIGLPGETVEIRGGQVYIEGKQLDTFYGKATMHGMGEEEYFRVTDSKNIYNEAREYFNTNMEKVEVGENAVFLLVDQWWRGVDSRDFGPVRVERILGVVAGHEDEKSEEEEELFDSESAAVEKGVKSDYGITDGVVGKLNYRNETYYVFRIHQLNGLGISKVTETENGQFKWETFPTKVSFGTIDTSAGYLCAYMPISEEANILLGQVVKDSVMQINITGLDEKDIIYDRTSGFFAAIVPKNLESFNIELVAIGRN